MIEHLPPLSFSGSSDDLMIAVVGFIFVFEKSFYFEFNANIVKLLKRKF